MPKIHYGRHDGNTRAARTGATGVPDTVAMRTMRAGITARNIACPDCKAEPGTPCMNTAGTAMTNYHATRRRMATRAANALVDSRAAQYADTVSAQTRRAVREHVGFTQRELAKLFGVNEVSFRHMEEGTRSTYDVHYAAYGAWLRMWVAGQVQE